MQAARIPDGIERLRYLRRATERRKQLKFTLSLVGLTCAILASFSPNSAAKLAPIPPVLPPVTPPVHEVIKPPEKVWMVEQHENYAGYSNGLQIRTDYVSASVPRRYRAFSRSLLTRSEERTVPAGIVYHTTESLLLPLEPERNGSLIQTREDVLRHVQRDRLYNFVIDRYGVVFRIVPEDQVAHHAGHSVWADTNSVYLDLNESFIGVAFEARTGKTFEPAPAQVRSGRLLTDLLRNRFAFPESNCVTHAQVSVNPDNMRFGYHTDWAAEFPFREFGLSSGYSTSVPAVEIFGFDYDQTFLNDIGGKAWDGLLTAERRIIEGAQQRGTTQAAYRRTLQTQFRNLRSLNHEHPTAANRT